MAFPDRDVSHPDRIDSNQTFLRQMRTIPRSLRFALLAAVAVGVFGGGALDYTLFPRAANAQSASAQPLSGPASFAPIVDRVRNAVVSVKVKLIESSANGNSPLLPFQPGDPFERFFWQFGQIPHHQPRVGEALGSGFIISPDGYVVTNNHVVKHATKVTVTLNDGRTAPAKVVGTDPKTDLALLKIEGGGTYPYVQFASQVPHVGDWVIAVGNPFGLGGTVTAGIVSARGRDIGDGPYDDFLQIDAPVNRGNSGGPTFNTQGQVVGVNTAIYSPSGGSVGIGFAIPAATVKRVVDELKTNGKVTRGWIGVEIQPVTRDIADSLGLKSTGGALVAQVEPKSPAVSAGLKAGDVITAVNDEKVKGPRALARTIANLGPDKKVKLTYDENGSEKTVSLTLGTLPVNQKVASNEPSSSSQSGDNSLSAFGLTLAPASSVAGAGDKGVVVTDINPDGIAAQKGLHEGDVILEAGGHSVSKPSEVAAALNQAKKDGRKAVLLRVKSGDNTHFVALTTAAS